MWVVVLMCLPILFARQGWRDIIINLMRRDRMNPFMTRNARFLDWTKRQECRERVDSSFKNINIVIETGRDQHNYWSRCFVLRASSCVEYRPEWSFDEIVLMGRVRHICSDVGALVLEHLSKLIALLFIRTVRMILFDLLSALGRELFDLVRELPRCLTVEYDDPSAGETCPRINEQL